MPRYKVSWREEWFEAYDSARGVTHSETREVEADEFTVAAGGVIVFYRVFRADPVAFEMRQAIIAFPAGCIVELMDAGQ